MFDGAGPVDLASKCSSLPTARGKAIVSTYLHSRNVKGEGRGVSDGSVTVCSTGLSDQHMEDGNFC